LFEPTTIITLEEEISLIVFCRHSGWQSNEWVQQKHNNNRLLVRHFEREFHTQVRAEESIVPVSTPAMNVFPTIVDGAIHTGNNPIDCRIRFVQFLDARLDGETVVLFLSGIDGGLILPVAFETLIVRWPKLVSRYLSWPQRSGMEHEISKSNLGTAAAARWAGIWTSK
jgi:hypothetical protein